MPDERDLGPIAYPALVDRTPTQWALRLAQGMLMFLRNDRCVHAARLTKYRVCDTKVHASVPSFSPATP